MRHNTRKNIIKLAVGMGLVFGLSACEWVSNIEAAWIKKNIDAVVQRAEAAVDLNIFIWLNQADIDRQIDQLAERMAQESPADLPLKGIAYVVKDNIDTNFMPTSGGTVALRGKTPPHSAPAVTKLQEAGAILIGKTNLHELAFGITSNNAVFGPVRNPTNLEYIAGGSSGGTAAAIAAGIVDIGLGTDTGGSLRIPAALSGVYGFRPTVGRYGTGNVIPLSSTRDTVGLMSGNMDIMLRFDEVLTGQGDLPIREASQLRIGVPNHYFHEDLHPDVEAALNRTMATLEKAGVTIIRADMDADIGKLSAAVGFPMVIYEVVRAMPAYLRTRGQSDFAEVKKAVLSPDVKAVLEAATGAHAVSEAAYKEAMQVYWPQLKAAYQNYFSAHQLDAMLVATTPLPAVKIGEDVTTMLNGRGVPTFQTFIRNTDPTSNVLYPALTVPVGKSGDGLPIGLELVGQPGMDRRLLSAAKLVVDLLE